MNLLSNNKCNPTKDVLYVFKIASKRDHIQVQNLTRHAFSHNLANEIDRFWHGELVFVAKCA